MSVLAYVEKRLADLAKLAGEQSEHPCQVVWAAKTAELEQLAERLRHGPAKDERFHCGFQEAVFTALGWQGGTVHQVVEELERLRRLEERRFPIMGGPSIPWSIIAPWEGQALCNHSQTLERLAERGGLSPCEAVAVLTGKRFRDVRVTSDADALELLRQIVNGRSRTSV